MPTKFKNIAIMGRADTEGVCDTLNDLIALLKTRNVNIILEQQTAELLPNCPLPIVEHSKLGKHCDLIIVVGGDGSLLSAGRIAAEQNLPIVGINRGYLGFLTDIWPDELDKIDNILQGKYIEEKRFLLEAKIVNNKKVISQTALNDVVLLPGEMNRMLEFAVYINGVFVCNQHADGMIVATPTGSTAHALSGGGPIMHPGLDTIVLLPMFPHNLSSRPIAIRANCHIEIKMASHCKAIPNISCDGQACIAIADRGIISIKKHDKKLRLIHLEDYDYYATLRNKLHWEEK